MPAGDVRPQRTKCPAASAGPANYADISRFRRIPFNPIPNQPSAAALFRPSLSHGIVKLALVAGLLANRLWAYPASLAVMSLFIVYQLYRFSFTHSAGLIVLSLFDGVVMVLIWHEYRLMRRHAAMDGRAGPRPG